jgi:hypothetical protein
MRTYFFGRSQYAYLRNVEIPSCFKDLDIVLGEKDGSSDVVLAINAPAVRMAENICRRMADVDWYAAGVGNALREESVGKAACLAMTLLVGYFSSCKAVLDAAAITLNELFQLGLAPKQQDFSKEEVWKRLLGHSQHLSDRYKPYRALSQHVVQWRDKAVHRQYPIILPSAATEEKPRAEITLRLINDPQPEIRDNWISVGRGRSVTIDPLKLHNSWRSELVSMCAKLCEDIGEWAG